jgi:hypothetical protein
MTRERDESEVNGVQHQLDAHEHPERVALEDNAHRTDGEQNTRKC